MDILNTGKRIRYFRILNGMTQKALGMAAGFPERAPMYGLHNMKPVQESRNMM